MRSEPFILTQRHVSKVRLALKLALGITGASLAIVSVRYLQVRMRSADLADRVRMQTNTLSNLRQTTVKPPTVHAGAMPPTSTENSVVKVQTALEQGARALNCKIQEFQTSPDRAPYLSLFSLDTNKPDWEQIPIRITITGLASDTFATIERLRMCGVPIEPDSIEVARQSVDAKLKRSFVTLRLSFRVLVRIGAKA